MEKHFTKAHVVAVDMGYGHQRAAYPLLGMSEEGVINANSYSGIPESDKKKWEQSQSLYEKISRLKNVPILGNYIFGAMDHFQRIEPFYPIRDLSQSSIQLKQIYRMIHSGWGKHLIDKLNKNPLPLVTSFFAVAFFAEEHAYKGEIFALCTDTDISRAWAPNNPMKSRIQYLVPNKRVKERLKCYGIAEERIFVTGFPLPQDNIGENLSILKRSIGCRIHNLDPHGIYHKKYTPVLHHYLGKEYCDIESSHPLSITFAVGGAGAQREIGAQILESLKEEIRKGNIIFNLVAGVRKEIADYYYSVLKQHGFHSENDGVHVLYSKDKEEYFHKFNTMLLHTDILWTKPSELSFYAGLGLPIIMSPTIGSQEDFNKKWLLSVGAGFEQEDPRYTHQWLYDWLSSGWLAEAALNGFLNAPRNGTLHVEEVVLRGKRSEIEEIHLL